MKQRILVVAVLWLALALLIAPVSVQAANPPRLVSGSVQANYPTALSFRINAQSDADITDIRLQYQVERMSFAQVIGEGFLGFTPSRNVQAKWDWDMRRSGGLPPGAVVHYWWVIRDAAGNKTQTDPQVVSFDDTRYKWRELRQNKVNLFWYSGDDVFAGKLMSAAQSAIERMNQDTGARLERAVNIYIYGSSQDLKGSMIFPQEWTGGVAYTDFDRIAIGIAPSQLDWGTGAIAHELTHLVVHQMTANPYNSLPTWLNEGLSMYAEGELDAQSVSLLNSAVSRNRLDTVRSLTSPFSAFGQQSVLAYAESYSIVKYLITTYGQGKMSQLLATFKQGSGYDDAFIKVYGFDMDGLNDRWRQSLAPARSSQPSPTAALPSLVPVFA